MIRKFETRYRQTKINKRHYNHLYSSGQAYKNVFHVWGIVKVQNWLKGIANTRAYFCSLKLPEIMAFTGFYFIHYAWYPGIFLSKHMNNEPCVWCKGLFVFYGNYVL
jgi:hypothetical protein